VLDSTNLNQKHLEGLTDIADVYGCEIEYKMFDIDLAEAIRRDRLRENPVGDRIISNFYGRYIKED
jgi:predicted kinase